MTKILIVKTSALGDVIHAFPVVQLLSQKYPGAQIDWVVEQPLVDLVKSHPHVNQVFAIQSRDWRKSFLEKKGWQAIQQFRRQLQAEEYDLVYDLQGNMKSGLITWLARSPVKIGFGRQTVPEWPNCLVTNLHYNPPPGNNIRDDYLFLVDQQPTHPVEGVKLHISPTEQAKIAQILTHPHLQGEKKVMVCQGSVWTNKQMTQEHLAQFLQKIHQEGGARFLLIWGTEAEKLVVMELARLFPNHAVVIDRLQLATLQNLMAQIDLVISMDSLPLHLAGTTPTPTYGLFGASSANKYKPIGSHAYQGSCPYGKTFEKRCPILRTCRTGSCIKEINIDHLFSDFQAWWQQQE